MIINIDSEKIYSTSLALIDVVESYENLDSSHTVAGIFLICRKPLTLLTVKF